MDCFIQGEFRIILCKRGAMATFLLWKGGSCFFPDMFFGGLPNISINVTEGKRLGRGEKKACRG